jgi:hypothetical protein
MTTKIQSVGHVTRDLSFEQLAESHVNKRLGWQPRTPSHREAWRGLRKDQVATHRLSHLRHRLLLNTDI